MDGSGVNYEAFGKLEFKENCTTYYVRKKGRSHVADGTVCQDYCLAKNIDDETHVVCVADGHGGAEYVKSDIGSRLACEVFCDIVKQAKVASGFTEYKGNWLDMLRTKEFKTSYIHAWTSAVLSDYSVTEENGNGENEIAIIRKYGTTFLFAVYTKDKICIGQLGDGAILLFDDYNQYQLFKRHGVKLNSSTNSLASNLGKYAFVIDVFKRDAFSYVLLSTDGIYDRLDGDYSFLFYANSLVKQISEKQMLENPFSFEDKDVSEISKDDCTIALLAFEKKSSAYEHPEIEQHGYTSVRFKRSLNGIEIFEAEKDETVYEIHIVESKFTESDSDLKCCKCEKALSKFPLSDDKTALVYHIPVNWDRISELIESGEHLEKRYWFNENELVSIDYGSIDNKFTNEYWLDVYEKMMQLKEEQRIIHQSLCEYAFECAFVTADNEIVFLSDAFSASNETGVGKRSLFDKFFGYFNMIGKMSCGREVIPLFGCTSHGQNIVMLHAVSRRIPLGRVIFNKDKKIFGLWNATDSAWNVEDKKRGEIPTHGVLRLNRNQVFYVRCGETETSDVTRLVDGYARYEITIFEEDGR